MLYKVICKFLDLRRSPLNIFQGEKEMVIVISQQSCTLEQNRVIMEEELSRVISEERKHKFQGLLYVLDQLLLPVQDANAKTRIKSSMPFQEALEYFLAFQPHHSGTPTKYQRDVFREQEGEVNFACVAMRLRAR